MVDADQDTCVSSTQTRTRAPFEGAPDPCEGCWAGALPGVPAADPCPYFPHKSGTDSPSSQSNGSAHSGHGSPAPRSKWSSAFLDFPRPSLPSLTSPVMFSAVSPEPGNTVVI